MPSSPARRTLLLVPLVLLVAGVLWFPIGRKPTPSPQTPPEGGLSSRVGGTPGPRDPCEIQIEFSNYLESGSSLSREQKVRTLRRLLQDVDRTLRDETAGDQVALVVYKYPARRIAEELDELAPGLLRDEFGGRFTRRGYQSRNAATFWQFDPMEEAIYQTVFHDPEFIAPAWAMRILVAERRNPGNLGRLEALASIDHTRADVIRQFFTGYATTAMGQKQLRNALKVVDPARLKGCTWAEIGYGTGKIFQPLRTAIGPSGAILGVEIGPGYEVFARRVMQHHPQGWGEVTLIRGSTTSCNLPAASVDIVHEAGIHIGDASPDEFEKAQLPWLLSVRRALRPGGILVVNDSGRPGIEVVRSALRRAGFEEDRLAVLAEADGKGGRQDFVVSFRKPDR